jgi:putative hydrolase of the HAD superfamily
MTPRVLMVDVDGVVIRPRPGGWAAEIETDLGVSRALLSERFFEPHWRDVALGRADLMERLAPVLAAHAPQVTPEALVVYWFEKDAELDHELLADLARLRAEGWALHLATVQEHLRAAHLWTTLGLSARFDAIHYSAAYGCGKPEAAFFHAVAARTGFAPADMLLLDDKLDNVEGARAAGWRGALWTGAEPLSAVLAREGVAGG